MLIRFSVFTEMRNPEPLLDVPNACRGLNLDNRNVELLLFMNFSLLIARLLFNHLNKTGV
jgi:hypothetical protein